MDDSGPEVRFDHSQWCAFYDQKTGEIVHIHEYLLPNEEAAVSQEELVQQARTATGERLEPAGIRAIHPPRKMRFDPMAVYRVENENLVVKDRIQPGPGRPDERAGARSP